MNRDGYHYLLGTLVRFVQCTFLSIILFIWLKAVCKLHYWIIKGFFSKCESVNADISTSEVICR